MSNFAYRASIFTALALGYFIICEQFNHYYMPALLSLGFGVVVAYLLHAIEKSGR